MNSRFLISLALGVTVASASALTVSGTVQGNVTPDTRIGGFVVTPFGQPVQELGGAAVTGQAFRLELPAAAPPARAQAVLTPQNVSWPGVIDPVQVSAAAQVAELQLFAYRDQNGNNRRDEGEPLRELVPLAGKATLFIAWVSADVTVTANKGYQTNLKKGWNAFLVEVGRTVNVQPLSDGTAVDVNVGR